MPRDHRSRPHADRTPSAGPTGFRQLVPLSTRRQRFLAALASAGALAGPALVFTELFDEPFFGMENPAPGWLVVAGLAFAPACVAYGLWHYRGELFVSGDFVRVWASARAYRPGDELRVGWELAPATRDVEELRFSLERRHYGARGAKGRGDIARRTLARDFGLRQSIGLATVSGLADVRAGELSHRLPENARPSHRRFRALHVWVLRVEARVTGRPPLVEEYPISIGRARRDVVERATR